MSNTIIHKHSSVVENSKPKLPSKEILEYGELAVNYAKDNETISLKNTSDEIVEFKSKNYFEKIIEENELVIASALNHLNDKLENIDTNYPVVEIGGEEQLMTPNVYYIANNKNTLMLTFETPANESIVNEYVVEINCPENSNTTLYLRDNVKWAKDLIPELVAGKKYVISIINNLAIFAEF